MKPVSQEFLCALRDSHEAVYRARALDVFQNGPDPDGTEITIVNGDVQLDARAQVRGTLSLTTEPFDGINRSRWPSNTRSILGPFGHEIFVERGIAGLSGGTEWVPLGYYRIYGLDQVNPNGQIRIMAKDRMSGIIDARLIEPFQAPGGNTLGSIFAPMLTEVYPLIDVAVDDQSFPDQTVSRTVIAERDRYEFLESMVTGRGKVMKFDHLGRFSVTSPPDPQLPVFTVDEGEHGVLIEVSRELTREGVYNAVVVSGEATDETPVRAVRINDNPASFSFYHGLFGKVPRYFESQFITTFNQARDAADNLLQQTTGLPYGVDLSTLPHPGLEPDDPIRAIFNGRDELHVIERAFIPLNSSQTMSVITREQDLFQPGDPS